VRNFAISGADFGPRLPQLAKAQLGDGTVICVTF